MAKGCPGHPESIYRKQSGTRAHEKRRLSNGGNSVALCRCRESAVWVISVVIIRSLEANKLLKNQLT
jgi:hypothetical protein